MIITGVNQVQIFLVTHYKGMFVSTFVMDVSGIFISTISTMFITDLSGSLFQPDYISSLSTSMSDLSGTSLMSTILGDLSGAPIKIPLSINDLLNSYEATLVKETADRSAVAIFTEPSVDSLKPALYKWAAAGFPSAHIINRISIAPPSVCIDGVTRSLTYYFEYLLGKPIAEWLQALDDVTDGMIFTFSHDGVGTISLHVSRV